MIKRQIKGSKKLILTDSVHLQEEIDMAQPAIDHEQQELADLENGVQETDVTPASMHRETRTLADGIGFPQICRGICAPTGKSCLMGLRLETLTRTG
jgi:hypothetical protein